MNFEYVVFYTKIRDTYFFICPIALLRVIHLFEENRFFLLKRISPKLLEIEKIFQNKNEMASKVFYITIIRKIF